MSLIIDLADAITADLAANDFGLVIPWERSYGDWDLQLKEATDPRGDLVPVFNPETELETNGSYRYRAEYDIAIRQRFTTQDIDNVGRVYKDQIDTLVGVVEAANKLLLASRPDDTVHAAWESTTIEALYIKKHLREWSQFTGIIRHSFWINEDL